MQPIILWTERSTGALAGAGAGKWLKIFCLPIGKPFRPRDKCLGCHLLEVIWSLRAVDLTRIRALVAEGGAKRRP
jgi:hypothetical protein